MSLQATFRVETFAAGITKEEAVVRDEMAAVYS
jgi:hypothetical protein